MQSRLGERGLPLDSIEGHAAQVVYGKKEGERARGARRGWGLVVGGRVEEGREMKSAECRIGEGEWEEIQPPGWSGGEDRGWSLGGQQDPGVFPAWSI